MVNNCVTVVGGGPTSPDIFAYSEIGIALISLNNRRRSIAWSHVPSQYFDRVSTNRMRDGYIQRSTT
jgi:hypothetical protein